MDDSTMQRRTDRGGSDPPHPRHNVLVVDDYDDGRMAIVTLLEVKGFSVISAATGAVALDLLQGGERPCVILLDIRLPDMDGWEVWDRMKAHHELARTAVVVLSAERADHERARAVGIREFLQKPIDGRALVAAVDRHCTRRRPAA
jgi:CheY-like chemotaxis protein